MRVSNYSTSAIHHWKEIWKKRTLQALYLDDYDGFFFYYAVKANAEPIELQCIYTRKRGVWYGNSNLSTLSEQTLLVN